MRKLYCGHIRRGVERYLRAVAGDPSLRVVTRHSVQSTGDFNVFRSDLDLSVIVRNDLPADRRQKVIRRYQRLYRWLPFLGELETYDQTLFETKTQLEQEFGDWLKTIRLLRKLSRTRKQRPHLTSKYHLQKNLRGERQILSKLMPGSGSLSEAVVQKLKTIDFPSLAPSPGLPVQFSHFLSWSIGEHEDSNCLAIPIELRVTLLALLPDEFHLPAEWQKAILNARLQPQIQKLYNAIVTQELVTCVALRTEKNSGEMEDWLRHLKKEIFEMNLGPTEKSILETKGWKIGQWLDQPSSPQRTVESHQSLDGLP